MGEPFSVGKFQVTVIVDPLISVTTFIGISAIVAHRRVSVSE
jgi:hypothetical protein